MRKVTLIIPVYNEEKYIERMVSSIKQQTYNNLEVIIVNDGSTDNSLEILESITDDRFLIINKPVNEGVSAARNLGLDIASGDYVIFVDMDDIVYSRYVERLVEGIEETGADIAFCGYEKFNDEGIIVCNHMKEKAFYKGRISSYLFMRDMIHQEGIRSSLWNKIFRRDLIGDIRFRTNISIGEDLLFITAYMKNAETAFGIDEVLYGYYLNPNGAMSKILNATEFNPKWLSEWKALQSYVTNLRNYPQYDLEASELCFYRLLICAHKLYYLMEELGAEGQEIDKYKPKMEKMLMARRKIATNRFIDPKWKVKLLLNKK